MAKKVLIACDSFKGCLSSSEVNKAIAEGLRADGNFEPICFDVADGGEGFAKTLGQYLNCKTIYCDVCDPLGRPIKASYELNGNTAVIEMAAASGLTLIEQELRDPLKTSTYGTGQMIIDALQRGARKFYIGLGGSATNDGGAGMLAALGYRFTNNAGIVEEFPTGGTIAMDTDGTWALSSLYTDNAHPLLAGAEFITACDVNNPLCGTHGASAIFAPQKGVKPQDIPRLDAGLHHLANLYNLTFDRSVENTPGSGAAGGLAAAFIAAFDAKVVMGIDLILEASGFDSALADAVCVITGEGKLDTQTLMGKAPAGILRHAAKANVPVIALGGAVEDANILHDAGFSSVVCIRQKSQTLAQAIIPSVAKANLRTTATQIANLLQSQNK